jgi:hypothetical protein
MSLFFARHVSFFLFGSTDSYITNAGLKGLLPESISQLSSLEVLQLGSNNLTGTIPRNITDLLNLKVLGLYQNRFVGRLPPDMARLFNLERLYLSENKGMSGSLESLNGLNSLKMLNVSHCSFIGEVPDSLVVGATSFSMVMDARDNCLTGDLKGYNFEGQRTDCWGYGGGTDGMSPSTRGMVLGVFFGSLAGFAVLLAALALGVFWLRRKRQTSEEEEVSKVSTGSATNESGMQFLPATNLNDPLSPNGRFQDLVSSRVVNGDAGPSQVRLHCDSLSSPSAPLYGAANDNMHPNLNQRHLFSTQSPLASYLKSILTSSSPATNAENSATPTHRGFLQQQHQYMPDVGLPTPITPHAPLSVQTKNLANSNPSYTNFSHVRQTPPAATPHQPPPPHSPPPIPILDRQLTQPFPTVSPSVGSMRSMELTLHYDYPPMPPFPPPSLLTMKQTAHHMDMDTTASQDMSNGESMDSFNTSSTSSKPHNNNNRINDATQSPNIATTPASATYISQELQQRYLSPNLSYLENKPRESWTEGEVSMWLTAKGRKV